MTYSPQSLKDLASYVVSQGVVNLGVVGDTAHQTKGTSYHLGQSQLQPGAYSATGPRDREPHLTEAASAIDLGKVGGSLKGLQALSSWLARECADRASDTLDIREVIWSPDGRKVVRWDRERIPPTTGSNSHLTHTHISFYRDSEKRDKRALFRRYFESKENTMSEQDRLGAAIETISERYLGNVIAAGDTAGILKWSTRLADYATRLAALVSPPLTKLEAADLGEVLTKDEAKAKLDAAVTEYLRAAGKPYGTGSEPRGSIPWQTLFDLATKLGVADELAVELNWTKPAEGVSG